MKSARVHFALTEDIPLDGVMPGTWHSAIITQDAKNKTGHVNRINDERCVLQTLRTTVCTKEVSLTHAYRFFNPNDDLPKDFESKRQRCISHKRWKRSWPGCNKT